MCNCPKSLEPDERPANKISYRARLGESETCCYWSQPEYWFTMEWVVRTIRPLMRLRPVANPCPRWEKGEASEEPRWRVKLNTHGGNGSTLIDVRDAINVSWNTTHDDSPTWYRGRLVSHVKGSRRHSYQSRLMNKRWAFPTFKIKLLNSGCAINISCAKSKTLQELYR